MHNDQARLRAAYEVAMQALSPLPRAAFLLCRVDDLSYREIGRRLSVEPAVVEECIALTLFSFSQLWRGQPPGRSKKPMIIEAEAALFQEYRTYCARAIMALVPIASDTSNHSACGKHNWGIIQSPHRWALGIRIYLTHCTRQKRRPAPIPEAKTFDEWLRSPSGAERSRDDQRHASMLVAKHLVQCWTPEQIAGRLRLDEADPITVCHETIYQYVYGNEGRQLGLWSHLPRQRKARRQRYARKPRGLNIPLENTIAQRPSEIGERSQFGHWEGDLIAFRLEFGKSNLTSLVERRSRYIVLSRNPSRHSNGVMTGIEHHLAALPQTLRQSITFDRGTEFAAFARLETKLGITSYFCKPSAPWQKGSVENSNGRIRRFLSLDTDIAALPDAVLAALTQRLNDTPRKCLGFRTPAEVFREQIAAHGPL